MYFVFSRVIYQFLNLSFLLWLRLRGSSSHQKLLSFYVFCRVSEFFFFPRAAGIFGVGWELACEAGAWRLWAQERTGAREGDTRGERERLPERSMKIVSSPLF